MPSKARCLLHTTELKHAVALTKPLIPRPQRHAAYFLFKRMSSYMLKYALKETQLTSSPSRMHIVLILLHTTALKHAVALTKPLMLRPQRHAAYYIPLK